jgi:hypothetical protein
VKIKPLVKPSKRKFTLDPFILIRRYRDDNHSLSQVLFHEKAGTGLNDDTSPEEAKAIMVDWVTTAYPEVKTDELTDVPFSFLKEMYPELIKEGPIFAPILEFNIRFNAAIAQAIGSEVDLDGSGEVEEFTENSEALEAFKKFETTFHNHRHEQIRFRSYRRARAILYLKPYLQTRMYADATYARNRINSRPLNYRLNPTVDPQSAKFDNLGYDFEYGLMVVTASIYAKQLIGKSITIEGKKFTYHKFDYWYAMLPYRRLIKNLEKAGITI